MKRLRLRVVLAGLAFAAAASIASADELRLLCAGAMRAPVSALLAKRGSAEPRVEVVYGTAGAIREKLDKGEMPDVVIAPSTDIQILLLANKVSLPSRRALGETGIGVAVRADAPAPDIATRESLRATLLAARKVVTVDPTKGTSGRLLQAIFAELGIADAMRAKTFFLDGGFVVEAVAKGEADIGLQQITEILPVKGVKFVGPLPPDLQKTTRYDAGIVVGTRHEREAEALLADLTSDDARHVIEAAGFRIVR